MPDTQFDRAQETDLTLWADSVARNLDDEGHSDFDIRSSGTPITAEAATSGCWKKRFSTSAG